MIITFVGHSKIQGDIFLYDSIYKTIMENITNNERILFYCGGYGDFDNLCAKVCSSVRKEMPDCEMVYVTPYILVKSKQNTDHSIYDSVIYPPIENTPPKFAIIKRNEWMVNEADLIIAYVNYSFGAASKTLEYAKGRKKRIINLAENK